VADLKQRPWQISPGMSIKGAIEAYIMVLQDDGLPVPEEKFDFMLMTV
jgi:predicted RNase H-like HicB family nuclease